MPEWLRVAVPAVLAQHDQQLALYGGMDGIRDLGGLESALGRPKNLAAYGDPDIASLAASYAAGIAKAHAFADGNKRTAWVVAYGFLILNGQDLEFDDAAAVALMLQVATGDVSDEALAQWFRDRMAELK